MKFLFLYISDHFFNKYNIFAKGCSANVLILFFNPSIQCIRTKSYPLIFFILYLLLNKLTASMNIKYLFKKSIFQHMMLKNCLCDFDFPLSFAFS